MLGERMAKFDAEGKHELGGGTISTAGCGPPRSDGSRALGLDCRSISYSLYYFKLNVPVDVVDVYVLILWFFFSFGFSLFIYLCFGKNE